MGGSVEFEIGRELGEGEAGDVGQVEAEEGVAATLRFILGYCLIGR